MGNSSTDHPGSSSFIVIVGGLRLVSSSPTTHRPVTRAHETSSTANEPLAMLELPSSVAYASHAACVRTAWRTKLESEQSRKGSEKQNRILPRKRSSHFIVRECWPLSSGVRVEEWGLNSPSRFEPALDSVGPYRCARAKPRKCI